MDSLPPLDSPSHTPSQVLQGVVRRHYASQSRSANPPSPTRRKSLLLSNMNRQISNKLPFANESEVLEPVLASHGYNMVSLIGHGGFSIVFMVTSIETNTEFAAKCVANHPFPKQTHSQLQPQPLQQQQQQQENSELTKSEIDALKSLNHPHIIKLYDYFESQTHSILILQICKGGTLDLLIKPGRGLARDLLIPYMKIILETVAFCHSHNIAHRDIKPHNFFIDSFGRPILGDFGLSRFQPLYGKCNSFGGSALYRSPEIIQHLPHDPFKADIWSLGVLFFQMVSGCDPWPTADSHAMKYSIINAEYFIPSNVSANISHVIRLMLTLDPLKRPAAAEILEHPLFKDEQPIPPFQKPQFQRQQQQLQQQQQQQFSQQKYQHQQQIIFLQQQQINFQQQLINNSNNMNNNNNNNDNNNVNDKNDGSFSLPKKGPLCSIVGSLNVQPRIPGNIFGATMAMGGVPRIGQQPTKFQLKRSDV